MASTHDDKASAHCFWPVFDGDVWRWNLAHYVWLPLAMSKAPYPQGIVQNATKPKLHNDSDLVSDQCQQGLVDGKHFFKTPSYIKAWGYLGLGNSLLGLQRVRGKSAFSCANTDKGQMAEVMLFSLFILAGLVQGCQALTLSECGSYATRPGNVHWISYSVFYGFPRRNFLYSHCIGISLNELCFYLC